jgi:hypothetical protein
MLTPNPDWIAHRLEVTGPDKALQDFIMKAQGPGYLDWRWPAGEDREYWAAVILRGGAPSPAAAERLAARYAEYLWWTQAQAQDAVDRGELLAPLDLHALRPVPRKVLRAGWREEGRDWMWRHWGTCLPLRRVTFRFEHRRQASGAGIEVAAVYEFEAADWSPWRAWRGWQRKWSQLMFNLKPTYETTAPPLTPALVDAA